MAVGPTKMVFIISDEDLVHKISSKKSTDTRIIDLDNHKHIPLTVNENNIINLALAELSKLHSTDDNQLENSNNLICKICGDHAIGYNYDVLSCASCKAFFRRNADQQPEELKCVTGKSECLVAHGKNRKCHRCRLNRCLAMGMRKDFIMKKEEKQKRKKRSEPSTISLINSDPIPEIFDEIDQNEDLIIIENLQSLFISTMQDEDAYKFCISITDPDAAIMSFLQSTDQTALRFINYFRQINEFENLNSDDRFILMKYNLLPAFPIHKCFNYRPENHYLSSEDNEQSIRFRQFFSLFDETNIVRDLVIKLVTSLVKFTEQNPKILSLLLIIIVFSPNLSMNENEPLLNDSLSVNRIQSYYIKILWNHLINKWNEQQTCRYFIQLLDMIFQIQLSSKLFRDFVCAHHITRDHVDQITPLMQTFLNIS